MPVQNSVVTLRIEKRDETADFFKGKIFDLMYEKIIEIVILKQVCTREQIQIKDFRLKK